MKLRLAELLTIAATVAALPLRAQTYTIQDLGTAPGTILSRGNALNDLGEACGTSDYDGYFATLFSNGEASELSTLVAGDHGYAQGIDNARVIVVLNNLTTLGHRMHWFGAVAPFRTSLHCPSFPAAPKLRSSAKSRE